MKTSKFPASDGWIRMELSMKTATPMSEAEIKELASFGKPDLYEWGLVEQYGKKVKVINRQLKAA